MATRSQLRKPFQKARSVDPRPITGRESPHELLQHAFGAYVGRQVRTAYELMRRSMEEDCSIFLTLSGAMTPAGLHQSCLIPLIERGVISALTTTGANLYHDAHRIIGHAIREVNPNAGDLQLRLARVIRIYDLGFWEEALLDTDKLFSGATSRRWRRRWASSSLLSCRSAGSTACRSSSARSRTGRSSSTR